MRPEEIPYAALADALRTEPDAFRDCAVDRARSEPEVLALIEGLQNAGVLYSHRADHYRFPLRSFAEFLVAREFGAAANRWPSPPREESSAREAWKRARSASASSNLLNEPEWENIWPYLIGCLSPRLRDRLTRALWKRRSPALDAGIRDRLELLENWDASRAGRVMGSYSRAVEGFARLAPVLAEQRAANDLGP